MKSIGRRKYSIGLLLIFILCNLKGCYNYKDINTVTFTTSIIFDIDSNENVVIYMDCMKPYRDANQGSDNGKRIIYRGKGKSALEAIRDVNLSSSYKSNFTQNRAIIFTENAAKSGIDKYLNLINNDQEFQVKAYAFVFFGDVENLINITSKDEEYLGVFLDELVHKNKSSPRIITSNINDYITNSVIGDTFSVLSAIEIKSDITEDRIEMAGGAIMKDNKLVDRITINEGMTYNFLKDKIKTGTLEIGNPQMNKGYVTLEILNNKTKTDIEYKNDKILLTKKINTKTALAEAQGRFIANEVSLQRLIKNEEENTEQYIIDFFNKCTRNNIDILGIDRLLEINYPKECIKDPLSKVELNVEVEIEINNGGRIKNSML